jgi:arylsulfatase A-like enzyme
MLFLLFAGIFAVSFGSPNFLVLLVDDWGSGDLDICPPNMTASECPFQVARKGRKQLLHNPNLRKLAADGTIMSNFYAPRAICTPSRAGILTGRDPSRFGMVDELVQIIQGAGVRGGLPPSEKTFAKYVKELDYTTGYTGVFFQSFSFVLRTYL